VKRTYLGEKKKRHLVKEAGWSKEFIELGGSSIFWGRHQKKKKALERSPGGKTTPSKKTKKTAGPCNLGIKDSVLTTGEKKGKTGKKYHTYRWNKAIKKKDGGGGRHVVFRTKKGGKGSPVQKKVWRSRKKSCSGQDKKSL